MSKGSPKGITITLTEKEARALRYAVDILHSDYPDAMTLMPSTRRMLQAAERADFKLAAALRELTKIEGAESKT